MTWTPPGPCDPRALAHQERHGQSADERHDCELERRDREAEHASLPAGHPALSRPEDADDQVKRSRP